MGSKKIRNVKPAEAPARREDSVAIGFVHGDRIHPQWRQRLTQVIVRDALTKRRIVGEFDTFSSGAHVATGRCKIVRDFLKLPSKPEWLWMVDTDATFAATILDQLLESADPVERPIVGGLAFGMKPATDAQGREIFNDQYGGPIEVFPTLYLFNEQGKTFQIRNYARDSMVEVHGTGCHCLLIHRSVLEHPCWDTKHPLPWFRSGTTLNGGEVSEDLFFCLAAKAAGFPIYVNTAAKTGHVKEVVVDESMYLQQQALQGHIVEHEKSPDLEASDIVLIVPSRGRPQQAGELAQSWRETTTGRSVLWVCIDDDDPDADAYAAALGPDVHLLQGPRQRMCEWTNQMARVATAGNARVVASIGDDHRLEGDWEALVLDAVDDAGGTAIVYGDDGFQGEKLPTACFVTTDIVDALGWMCLPGLEHLFCDNAWKALGERAGVLRYLPDLSTPHLHPAAGKAEWDDSYRATNTREGFQRDGDVFAAWLDDGVERDVETVRALARPKRRRVVLVPSRDPVLCRSFVAQLAADEMDEVVVAWNGTNQAFRDWLGTQPVTVVDVDQAAGIHAWWNWAVDNRPDADVAFFNDDVTVEPGCIGRMFEALRTPHVVASCPNYDGREGTGFQRMWDICGGRYDGHGGLPGFAFAVSRDWLASSGYRFPEELRWWYGDRDLMATFRLHDLTAVMVLDARCEHVDGGGKTGDWESEDVQPQLIADEAWFREKWAGAPVPA